jgi:hypothetical protein
MLNADRQTWPNNLRTTAVVFMEQNAALQQRADLKLGDKNKNLP